ncbi:hypothetical protein ARSQ2_01767 [Arsenophonus endosymbiont of Bemisia tabaci Q2]|nr:hypothetical protein ARSQ2_01767 [Arsenophonus endosymbiont of Bemisia tabaci Q2]
MVAESYPVNYRKGDIIEGINDNPAEMCKVFHAGTEL